MTKFVISLLLLGFGLLPAEETAIGLVTKSSGRVNYRKYSSTELVPVLPKGSELFDNDFIQTGPDGFTKYVYLDDGSTIKITADTEIYVSGTVKGSAINKLVKIDNGILKFEVSPQRSTEFRIVTPTSVASVKGTVFWLKCNRNAGDQFFGFDGVVRIVNNTSRQSIQLGTNTVVVSLPTGELTVRPLKADDLKVLPEIDGETPGSGTFENEIRLDFQNEDGDVKQLIIKYQ
ncbi:MAG: FecR domain-containing protein [FCB group bacterium]|nr:FecR domain-containing protein [FCB group bacterium]